MTDIPHINHIPKDYTGWARVPTMDGLGWSFFKNGKELYVLTGTLTDSERRYELWVGDNTSGDSDTISYHNRFDTTEKAAERFIHKHPNGWD